MPFQTTGKCCGVFQTRKLRRRNPLLWQCLDCLKVPSTVWWGLVLSKMEGKYGSNDTISQSILGTPSDPQGCRRQYKAQDEIDIRWNVLKGKSEVQLVNRSASGPNSKSAGCSKESIQPAAFPYGPRYRFRITTGDESTNSQKTIDHR